MIVWIVDLRVWTAGLWNEFPNDRDIVELDCSPSLLDRHALETFHITFQMEPQNKYLRAWFNKVESVRAELRRVQP
jgi:hypothetical protein